jgi:hypothetical protein
LALGRQSTMYKWLDSLLLRRMAWIRASSDLLCLPAMPVLGCEHRDSEMLVRVGWRQDNTGNLPHSPVNAMRAIGVAVHTAVWSWRERFRVEFSWCCIAAARRGTWSK